VPWSSDWERLASINKDTEGKIVWQIKTRRGKPEQKSLELTSALLATTPIAQRAWPKTSPRLFVLIFKDTTPTPCPFPRGNAPFTSLHGLRAGVCSFEAIRVLKNCIASLNRNTQDLTKSIQSQCQQPKDLNMQNYRFLILFFLGLVSLALLQTSNAVQFICDGVTPQDVQINAALAAGGDIRLPAGTCIINNTLTIPNYSNGVSKTSLHGAGFTATTIQASSSFTAPQMIIVNGTTTITDLTLNGVGKNTWGIRNNSAGIIPSIFKSLSFVSLAGTGGGFINDAVPATYNISDSFFNSTNIAIYNAHWGVNSIISHNNVLGGQGILITNSGQPGDANEGIIVEGNTVVGAIKFEKCLQCVVSNNIVDGPAGAYSLNITGGTLYKVTNNWFGKGANAAHSTELFFSGNTFPDGYPAIFDFTSNVQFADNILQNPLCSQNCSAGQSLFILDSSNIQVHHNSLQGIRGAIYAGGNTHLLVEGNTFAATCDRTGPMTFVFNTGGTNCGNSLSYPTSW
jgi:hypothetical protein